MKRGKDRRRKLPGDQEKPRGTADAEAVEPREGEAVDPAGLSPREDGLTAAADPAFRAEEAGEGDLGLAPEDEAGAAEPGATTREQELEDQLARLMADFDNYRKRVRKEQAEADLAIRARLIEKLLPILDDYDRARGAAGQLEHPADRDVLLRILGRLAEVLEREGLSLIELQPGAPFDPSTHEAIGTAYSERIPAQRVLDVFEQGYVFNGQLLRPARVLVSLGVEESRDKESRDPETTPTGDGDKADDGADRKDSDE